MTEWKTYRAEDFCFAVTDGTHDSPKPQLDGRYIITSKHLKPSGIDFSSANKISEADYNKIIQRSKVEQYDILFSMIGTIGNIHRVTTPIVDFAVKNIGIFKMGGDADKSLWMYYWLQSPIAKEYIQSRITGSTQGYLTLGNLRDFPVVVPPLPEQRRIADILGAIDDKIENNRRINTNLELQAQALFEEWLCKVNTIKGTFNDIIDATLAGDWGQETTQGNYTHEVFCIRGADIPALQNGDKGKMPIRYILEKNYKTKQLCANDLVIEISGGSPTQSTGRICMITQSLLDRLGKDVVCTNFCRAITPKNGYAIYIYLYWQMLYNKNTMFSYENGTTGIKNLNIADLISKEPIEIPAQKDVEKLNVVLQPIFDKIYANGLQNETLANLRDTLLPKLMNGEIKL
jgi:type I restriction enzyme S subunit